MSSPTRKISNKTNIMTNISFIQASVLNQTSRRQMAGGFLFMLFTFLAPALLSAANIPVNSISALQNAIGKAVPGDVITLANGKYTTSQDITVSNAGTAAKPITIAAQSIGGAEISGAGGFHLNGTAAHIIIRGFKFTHTSSKARMAAGSSFCRWTRNIFQTTGNGEYLTVNGNDHQVDYNTFQHKTSMGRFLTVRGTGSQIAQRIWIHHNYFYDFKSQGGPNGAEAFQFGLSGFSLSSSNSLVEHNLFEDCEGENELISIKTSEVTLRYNTIRNCKAQFTLRHGNRCQVYGNYFVNTPGLRFFGDDHVIHSNHFEQCNPAINIGNGGAEVADGAKLTSHDRPDRVLIAFNTLVNNKTNIAMNNRENGLGATHITIAHNIIQGGEIAATITGPFPDPKWQDNLLFQVGSTGDMPAGSFRTQNPKLVRDAAGLYRLQAGSHAIGVVQESYPAITVDMEGQPRTAPLDLGADEVSKAPVTGRLLTPALVGHNAKEASTPKKGKVAKSK
jgi:poly(beta-D-mannuronate) lyase